MARIRKIPAKSEIPIGIPLYRLQFNSKGLLFSKAAGEFNTESSINRLHFLISYHTHNNYFLRLPIDPRAGKISRKSVNFSTFVLQLRTRNAHAQPCQGESENCNEIFRFFGRVSRAQFDPAYLENNSKQRS